MKSIDIQSENSELKQPLCQEEKILIVDDNDINRKMLCTYLKALGHETLPAANGQHALELLETHPIHLIFMDLRMPVMNGYETTKLIRGSNHPYKDIPIIGLSADGLAESLRSALEAGMNEYLIKPVKRDDLEQLLQKWLPGPVAPQRASPEGSTRHLSISELRGMIAYELPAHRQTIRHKLQTNDYQAIYDVAHKIVGGSIYCELPALEAAALALQNAARQKDPMTTPEAAAELLRVIDQTLLELT
ncbi:MAG TPA: response regulator [Gammaproteobacteria bacterium]|jgi:CheY-like chemotaxis protein/HPt (histidine-containing phosphotransfer) domain-containing protein